MRLIAALCTVMTLAAAGFAGQALWQEVNAPVEDLQPMAAGPETDQAAAPAQPRATRHWPPIFGEPQPPAPAAPPKQAIAEPQPPKQPKPPLSSLGYTLKGVVRAGPDTWAVLSHPTGEKLLRRGEKLGGGIVVARINEAGIWLSRDGDEAELLAFPEQR
ncbi:type II secretion system protein N [Thalassovita aquimarina]|uniref:type II secretion system protein N n=1 Tax=Thalassovita aquimarina TaxID=2785917 RepID=UPI00356664B8